jgi:glycerol-3-phosphate acyltransferase PlsY
MMFSAMILVLFAVAYLLGSIPTALLVSLHIKVVDIRRVGNGNMGAQNVFHEIGPKYGVLVAAIDLLKGALPVFLAHALGMNIAWQITAGIFAILGHDFPLFADFRGGQGTAVSLGTMLVLFPLITLAGLITIGIIYLLIKHFNKSTAVGCALIALTLGLSHHWLLLIYAVLVFLFIPVRLFMDTPRRVAIELSKNDRS